MIAEHELSSELADGNGGGFGGLARTVAAKWKSLDPENKGPYEHKADRERERYKVKLASWRETQAATSQDQERQIEVACSLQKTSIRRAAHEQDPGNLEDARKTPALGFATFNPSLRAHSATEKHYSDYLQEASDSMMFDHRLLQGLRARATASWHLAEGYAVFNNSLTSYPDEVATECSSASATHAQPSGNGDYWRGNGAVPDPLLSMEPLPLYDINETLTALNSCPRREEQVVFRHVAEVDHNIRNRPHPTTVAHLMHVLDKEDCDLLVRRFSH